MTEIEKIHQENVNVARQLYAAFAQRDMESLPCLLSPEVDWLFFGPPEVPFAGHFHGPQQVTQFFAQAMDAMEFLQFEPREFIAGGTDNVLVQGYERARALSTGKEWETEWAHVFTIQDQKIVKLREYYDTAVIAAAFSE